MKLSARDLARLIETPDPKLAGVLIFGADAMRVALKRQALVAAILGPRGADEMRLDRLGGDELRRDGARLGDLMRAQGFFPGPRVVLVDDASDQVAGAILAAFDEWRAGDAQLVVTAGALKPSSKLRKGIEGARNAGAAAIYADPPGREEIARALREAGLAAPEGEVMRDLETLARALDPGDFAQCLEKLALYKFGDASPVSAADLSAVAPLSTEAAVDDLLDATAGGQAGEVGPLLRRLQAQGVQAVTLAIMALRHFRTLHMIASNPAGVDAGLRQMRPPVFGPRRDRLQGQAQKLGRARLERALGDLVEADLTLRSASNAPSMAVMERALIRLAMRARS